MMILVTGGAGFIGQYLARRLIASGHEALALDVLLPQVHQDPDRSRRAFPGQVVQADVADPSSWDSLPSVDAVAHLAAETGTAQSMYETDRYRRVNVDGSRLAGEFAARRGIPIVSISSRAVYGEGGYACPEHGGTFGPPCCDRGVPQASRESDPHQPVSFYGQTKSEAEAALAELARDIPLTSLRPQNVVGAGQALHNPYTGVLAAFLAMLKEQRPITIYGTGTQTRDFFHVDDLAAVIEWALTHHGDPGAHRVLNVGSGERTTLQQLAEYAALGAPVPSAGITHLDVHRAGDIEHACADLTNLGSAGAPRARWTPKDAVADFVTRSWALDGAPSSAWSQALGELEHRGLTS